MSHLHTLRLALRLLREESDRQTWTRAGATLMLVAVSGTLAALSPLALKHLVDALDPTAQQGHPATHALLASAAAYLVVVCGGRLAADVRPLLADAIDQRLQAALRHRFLDHVLRLPMSYLLQQRSGQLIHSLDLAGAGFQSITSHITGSLVPAAIELVTMIVVLASIGQPELVGVFAITSVVYVTIHAMAAMRLTRHANDVSAASLTVYAHLSESVGHVETLRSFTAERQAQATLREASQQLVLRWLKFNRLNAIAALAISAAFTLSLAACLWIATSAAAQGRMTTGGVVLTSVYMLQMVRPLEVLGCAARDLSRALSFMRPLLDLLSQPVDPDGNATPTTRGDPCRDLHRAPSIRFENVHFGYARERPIFQGLSLEIQAGSTTAIVGPSGSGKSSLARLLMGLHSPQVGAILIDGHRIDEMPGVELRASIGLVPQDTALLHGSIASNIALGMAQSSPADVASAAREAQLHDLIGALPLGIETPVGERGLHLSGGERQRIAIARAVLRRPSLYVLDEPTSMLDSNTEAVVMGNMRHLTVGSTTLVIAHRLCTVMHADEIIVLDRGRVLARGRHDDLLAAGGLYARLWQQQTAGAA